MYMYFGTCGLIIQSISEVLEARNVYLRWKISPALRSDQQTFRCLSATANSPLAGWRPFNKRSRIGNIFKYSPYPIIARATSDLGYFCVMKKTLLGTAIFVLYSKNSNFFFASTQQTFAANSLSVA